MLNSQKIKELVEEDSDEVNNILKDRDNSCDVKLFPSKKLDFIIRTTENQ